MITSGGSGTITISAEDDVLFGADGDVTGASTVTVTAGTGEIQVSSGTVITAALSRSTAPTPGFHGQA